MLKLLVGDDIFVDTARNQPVDSVALRNGLRVNRGVFVHIFFTELLVQRAQYSGSSAEQAATPSIGAPTTTPTPVSEAAIVPEERRVVKPPREIAAT